MSKLDNVEQSQPRKEPSFRRITPGDGAKYLEGMISHCLSVHSEIVPWLSGSIDTDMLEFPPEWRRRNNLARRGGTYKDSKGLVCVLDQTLVEYRDTLDAAVRETDTSVDEEWTDSRVARVLYPKATAKARSDKRARLNLAAQALLGKAMLLWPSQDVRDLMAQDTKLMSAFESLDLIAFVNALKEFCLEGTGNVDNNIRIAEDHITKLKMVRLRFTQYVKDFKAAAENLATCGSTFTQERIVTLFVRNLDQSVFINFFVNFLDVRHSLNELKTGTLLVAITVVHEYYNSVIRVVEDDEASTTTTGSGGGGGSGSPGPAQVKASSAKGLKEIMSSPKTGSDIVVSHEVLAAFVRSTSKVGDKRKKDPSLAAGDKKPVEGTPPAKKGKCYAIERGEVCKWGATCRFLH